MPRPWLRGTFAARAPRLLALLLVAGSATLAWAHGGEYQPPPREPPTYEPPPIDRPPPPPTRGAEPGNPTTGGGGGGGTRTPDGDVPGGSRDVGGPTTPGGGDVGGPQTGSEPPTGFGKAPGAGPTTGGGAPIGPTPPPRRTLPPTGGLDPDHWSRWWYSHRSNLLSLDARIDVTATNTPGGAAPTDLWRAEAQQRLTAALRDRDEDVASGAAIALGKGADASDGPALTEVLRDRSRQAQVREAAALGLGLLAPSDHPASAAATRALQEVAASDRERERLRAIAAWSLGLRRDVASVPFLLDLAASNSSTGDVPAAATSALGLTGCELAREPLVAWLEGTPGRKRHETLRRVHAAHGLAHLGDRSVVPALREACRDDDEEVRRAAVLALGALAARDDEETSLLLQRLLDRDRDRGVRNMAAISLGRIAPKQAEKALRYAYAKADGLTQCFAALGLGLLARTTGEAGLTGDLRQDLKDRANGDLRGALAIALGLARDRAAARTLRALALERGEPELRAHAAVALGMIGDAAAADSLRTILAETRDPVLQRETALALGLLGDVRSLEVLTKMVGEGSSNYVQGAAAVALGRIGGADASRTLGDLLADTNRTGLARGMAAVGLGRILDRTAGRGLGRVGTDLNWYFRTPSVEEILTIL